MNMKYGVLGTGNVTRTIGELFLATKVWITNVGEEKVVGSFDESLRKLWTDYIDLLFVHQPFCFQAKRGRIFLPIHY